MQPLVFCFFLSKWVYKFDFKWKKNCMKIKLIQPEGEKSVSSETLWSIKRETSSSLESISSAVSHHHAGSGDYPSLDCSDCSGACFFCSCCPGLDSEWRICPCQFLNIAAKTDRREQEDYKLTRFVYIPHFQSNCPASFSLIHASIQYALILN